MLIKIIITSILIFPLINTIAYASSITINEKTYRKYIGKNLRIVEDISNSYSFPEIIDNMNIQWKKSDKNFPNYGLTNSAYWAKFTIKNDSNNTFFVFLECAYSPLDKIELFYKDHTNNINKRIAGDSFPFKKREIDDPHVYFKLIIPPQHNQDYYMRFETKGTMIIPLLIHSAESMAATNNHNQVMHGIYFGIMLVMLFYNLILFFSIKDWSYLHYCLSIIGWIFFLGSYSGIAFQYIWPGSPWLANNTLSFFWFFTYFFAILFTRSFLHTFENNLIIDIFMKILLGISFMFMIATFFIGYDISVAIANTYQLCIMVVIIAVAIVRLLQNFRPARYFLIAWFAILAAAIASSLRNLTIIPQNYITSNAALFGSAVEVVLLSFALADRINIMKQEKDEAQQEALNNEKESVLYLKKIDKFKDEFLANTSHELKTPLNGIYGMAEVLLDETSGPLNNNQQKITNMILTSTKRLSHLVNDLLDLSRLKNQEVHLNRMPIDIHSMTELSITLLHPLAREKNLVIVNNVPKNISSVYADENRLQQILTNLLDNAVKFTEKGSITVKAIPLLEPEGDPSDRKGFIEVSITDTGIGIPKEKQEIIFQAFEQADSSTERLYGGTGLGLSITKKLIELHGGTIFVNSETNQGSTFTFTLPISEKDAEDETSQRILNRIQVGELSRSTTDRRKTIIDQFAEERRRGLKDRREIVIIRNLLDAKVLVVDDEPINLQVLKSNLSMNNIQVTTAISGEETLQLLERGYEPDIILLDIMMPKMNGYEVAEKIREKYSKEELPIIFVTAKNQVKDLVEGFHAGANDYITKPFSKNEIFARMESHICLARSRKDLTRAKEEIEDLNKTLEQKVIDRTQDLHNAKLFIESIIENSPFAIHTIDSSGIITLENHAMKKLLNDPEGNILGRNIFTFKGFKDTNYFDIYNNALQGKAYQSEKELFNYKNSTYYINIVVIPVIKNDVVEYVLTMYYDNTEKALAEMKLEKARQMISEDLSIAKSIQSKLIGYDPNEKEKLEIFTFFEPMIEVGGDLYDIDLINEKHYRIFLADAVGHGIQAALITMLIKSEYERIKHFRLSAKDSIETLNRQFVYIYENLNTYFTCFLIDIDLEAMEITYVSAGHPFQILLAGDEIIRLTSRGTLFGIEAHQTFDMETKRIEPGNRIYLYTDGIIEAYNESKKLYGIENFIESIMKNKSLSLRKASENILIDVNKWRGSADRNDDVTLIGIEIKQQ